MDFTLDRNRLSCRFSYEDHLTCAFRRETPSKMDTGTLRRGYIERAAGVYKTDAIKYTR